MPLRVLEGLPMVDANKTHVITVTKRDVDNEEGRQDPTSCVIARACKRELGATQVRIHRTRVYVKSGDKWTRFIASRAMQVELIAFDRGGRFQPGEYVLYKPQPSQKLGATKARDPNRRTGPKRNRFVPMHTFENVRPRVASE